MRKRKGKRKYVAQQIAKVPEGAKLIHDDANQRVWLAVDGTLYLIRLEYVTYRLKGPRQEGA